MKEAFLLINCENGCEDMVVDELSKLEEVREIQKIMGVYDVIAKLEADSENDIRKTISDKIRKIYPVNSVLTLDTL
ncbi:MAG: Lrp/AsnC ligand binding domain-containing protein [Thaumarchaeota archaeon]|nr:Lrp/AsnC ligand binding domain-containing protein [Nitrososphaerota archaeon]